MGLARDQAFAACAVCGVDATASVDGGTMRRPTVDALATMRAPLPYRQQARPMTKQPKPSQPAHGKSPSRHEGTKQHGWSPDVDETRQQDNPSAHRSFHPDEYAPDKGPGRTVSKEEAGNPHGKPVKSRGHAGRTRARDLRRRACTTWAPGAGRSVPAERRTPPPPQEWTPRTRPASAAADSRAGTRPKARGAGRRRSVSRPGVSDHERRWGTRCDMPTDQGRPAADPKTAGRGASTHRRCTVRLAQSRHTVRFPAGGLLSWPSATS